MGVRSETCRTIEAAKIAEGTVLPFVSTNANANPLHPFDMIRRCFASDRRSLVGSWRMQHLLVLMLLLSCGFDSCARVKSFLFQPTPTHSSCDSKRIKRTDTQTYGFNVGLRTRSQSRLSRSSSIVVLFSGDSTGSSTAAAASSNGEELSDNDKKSGRTDRNVGGYDPSENLSPEREVNVGDPQIKVMEKEFSVTSILRELAAIQQEGPRKYCILGTRHCSFLHQQIIELLAYALVLSGNHVYTSGAGGTHAATIRGAVRAERPDLLTVVLPQTRDKQSEETQKLLEQVSDVVEMPQNNEMSLDIASRICNSYLLSLTDQLISFAFHESNTVIEATNEAKKMDKLVTVLYLD